MFVTLLDLLNETLATAIVVIAVSMLLYNLTRNYQNRVARTSSFVLACITAAYLCDTLVSLGPSRGTWHAILRLQWVGIALMPAAMFHLSDALLATTGLPSRGRRRRVVRLLYAIGVLFLVLAAFNDMVIYTLSIGAFITVRPAPGFIIYIAYFLVATGAAFVNVQRARQRCLTRATQRRMAYLQFAMLTPPIGIFPFAALLPPGEEYSLQALIVVNLTNIVVVLMLLFLAYPLSFFGSRVPDRVVKRELLHFILLGPATGLLALVTIVFIDPAARIFGLPGASFIPFAVVAVILFWQWMIDLSFSWLEKRLIYSGEDYDHLEKIQTLSERILTKNDLLQLLEGVLGAVCDYLQVNSAFIAAVTEEQLEIVSATGTKPPNNTWLKENKTDLNLLTDNFQENPDLPMQLWQTYWIMPLYSRRANGNGNGSAKPHQKMIGIMGVQARSAEYDLNPEEEKNFERFVHRAAQALDDMALQTEIYAALEGLLPQINITRTRAAEVEYRSGRDRSIVRETADLTADREQVIEQVRAALRHFWGGPGLTSSRLTELGVVKAALAENENNLVRALRAILLKAIEKQRPEGERKMWSPEWTIYNILDLRFIDRSKVLDVAERLTMSEADFYRKQRIAIEAVADAIIEMEQTEHRE